MLNLPPANIPSKSPPCMGDGGLICENTSNDLVLIKHIAQVQQREEYYNSVPSYCGHNVMFKPNEPESLTHMPCNRLSCERCRPKIKRKVIDKLIETCEDRHLQRELILTCPGNEWRETHSPDESFKWLNEKFREFKILYERETGKKLVYIKLPRSQKSGYCHHHIMINTYIKKALIEDIIKRIGLGTSYKIMFKDLHRLRTYLKNELHKEHEWFIPVGMRHVSSSMEINDKGKRTSIFIMWQHGGGCWISVIFGRYIPPQIKYDFVYDVMQNYGDRPPPYWFFVQCFTDMNRIRDSVGYIAESQKYYLPSSYVPESLPAYNYQMDLLGRMHRIMQVFEEQKYTRQIKFKRDR